MGKKVNHYDQWQDYPVAAKRRGGCKVSWNYYATKEEAEACAKAAVHNAHIALREGYDFGYCSPGQIKFMPAGPCPYGTKEEYGGLYEVCLP